MPTLERPLKEGSVRTYQAKVGLGFLDILASEVDADLDTIYAAWNGTLGGDLAGTLPNPTVAPGAITAAKIAAGVIPTTLPPSGAAGGDLAGSSYPNPIVAAGTITKAKLGVDCAGVYGTDFSGSQVGANTNAWTRLVTIQATALLTSRLYRFSFGGTHNIGAGSLSFNSNIGGQSVCYVPGTISGTGTFVAMVLWYCGAPAGWFSSIFTFSNSRAAVGTMNTAQAMTCAGSYGSGISTLGPVVDIQFSVANAGNLVVANQAILEIF
jgi:hypothetical protein